MPKTENKVKRTTDGQSNPLNFPKTERFELGPGGKPKLVTSRIRYGLKAPPGHVVINADLAQIEARITATLAGQESLVRGFAMGEDVYSDCASDLFGWPVSKKLIEENPDLQQCRDTGKFLILGGNFGMGAKKAHRQGRKAGLNMPLADWERFIYGYRNKYDMIPVLWKTYEEALRTLIIERVPTTVGPVTFEWIDEQKRTAGVRGPNGLHLIYPRLRMVKDADHGWQIVCNQARDKFPRKLWGGAVTENVAQRLARDVIVDGMIGIQLGLGLRTALQVYDSVVLVVPADKAEYYAKAIVPILTRSPKWLPDLPVGVEVAYGPTYGHC